MTLHFIFKHTFLHLNIQIVVVQGKNKKVQMLNEILAKNELILFPVDTFIVPITMVRHHSIVDKHTPLDTFFSLD